MLPERIGRRARLAWAAARIAADAESARRIAALGRPAELTEDSGAIVAVRLRPLGGALAAVRSGTADVDTLWTTFMRGHHLPPPEVARRPIRRVWDLGCNAGLTMAHLAVLHPGAHLVGVELDARNVELARRNLAPWGARCEVIHAAAWPDDGEVVYHRWPGATSAYRVAAPGIEGPTVPALSLETLLAREPDRPPRVDYLKLDVEGAERELLRRGTGWAERVAALKVEVHAPYSVAECVRDVGALGFAARADDRHPAAVIGVRPS